MPRYHFHVVDGSTAHDEAGQELPGIDAAIEVATAAAREMIADDIRFGGSVHRHHRVEILDAEGNVLRIVCFSEIVAVQP